MRLPVPFAALGERMTPSRARELAEIVAVEGEVLYRLPTNWNVATTAAVRSNESELFDGLGLRFVTRKTADGTPGLYAVRVDA